MAYAKRRRPNTGTQDGLKLVAQMGDVSLNGPSPAQTPTKTEKEEKKKRRGKGLMKFLSCIKPLIKDEEDRTPAPKEPDAEDRCGLFKPGRCSD